MSEYSQLPPQKACNPATGGSLGLSLNTYLPRRRGEQLLVGVWGCPWTCPQIALGSRTRCWPRGKQCPRLGTPGPLRGTLQITTTVIILSKVNDSKMYKNTFILRSVIRNYCFNLMVCERDGHSIYLNELSLVFQQYTDFNNTWRNHDFSSAATKELRNGDKGQIGSECSPSNLANLFYASFFVYI